MCLYVLMAETAIFLIWLKLSFLFNFHLQESHLTSVHPVCFLSRSKEEHLPHLPQPLYFARALLVMTISKG